MRSAKILNSGVSKAKILKSAKILSLKFWKDKILNQGSFEFRILESYNLESKRPDFEIVGGQNPKFKSLTELKILKNQNVEFKSLTNLNILEILI